MMEFGIVICISCPNAASGLLSLQQSITNDISSTRGCTCRIKKYVPQGIYISPPRRAPRRQLRICEDSITFTEKSWRHVDILNYSPVESRRGSDTINTNQISDVEVPRRLGEEEVY